MGTVFEQFIKEENIKMMLLGAKLIKLQHAGKTVDEISAITGLSAEQVEEVFNAVKN